MEDEWYSPLIEFKKIGSIVYEDELEDHFVTILKKAVKRVILIDILYAAGRLNILGYIKKNGKIARCITR